MMTTKTIKLSRRYQAFDQPAFDQVTVREPTFNDLLQLGEPFEAQRIGEGNQVAVIEDIDVVREYVERCVTEPTFQIVHAAGLGLQDARAVRRGVLDFFISGEASSGP